MSLGSECRLFQCTLCGLVRREVKVKYSVAFRDACGMQWSARTWQCGAKVALKPLQLQPKLSMTAAAAAMATPACLAGAGLTRPSPAPPLGQVPLCSDKIWSRSRRRSSRSPLARSVSWSKLETFTCPFSRRVLLQHRGAFCLRGQQSRTDRSPAALHGPVLPRSSAGTKLACLCAEQKWHLNHLAFLA